MRRFGPLVTLAISAPFACSSNNAGTAQSRAVLVGAVAPSVDAGTLVTAAGASPAPQTCPSTAPVFCDAGCCTSGQTCLDDGGCAQSTSAAGCPSEMPVLCGAAVDCDGGCVAGDSSGAGRNLALRPPAGFVSGKYGTGISTKQNGYNCAIDIDSDAGGLPSGNAAETFEFWMNGAANMPWPATVGFVLQHDDRILYLNTPGPFTFSFAGQSPPAPIDGAWHFVAGTFDGTYGRLFVDGRLASTGSVTRHTAADAGLIVGGSNQNPCYYLPLDIDELRILDYAADGGQIAADFDAGHLAPIPGTVGLWHFDEGMTPRCCPAGTTCEAGGDCTTPPTPTAPCPSTDPVDCGNGQCCPSGWSCASGGGCAAPGITGSCPASATVDCGNGTCCPSGQTCVAQGCSSTPSAPTAQCNAGYITVQSSTTANYIYCCPTPLAGQTIRVGIGIVNAGIDCIVDGATSCATNYFYSSQDSGCVGTPQGTGAYCQLGPSCSYTSSSSGGCCTGNGTCNGNGACCPSGSVVCGSGCCAAAIGQTCTPACPTGSTCTDGACVAQADCTAGVQCGSTCCPAGEGCANGVCAGVTVAAICPSGSVACGPQGPCCPAGFACSGGTCVEGVSATHGGPAGPSCDGGFCDSGLMCGGGALCCPPATPQACGSSCCSATEVCASGQCACPSGTTSCGSNCCPAGSDCASGACVPSCGGAGACGGYCCNAGVACSGGKCACPSDHPVQCGDVCCLQGGTCAAGGGCTCPAGRDACGDDCCAAGQVCSGGACTAPSSGGGGCNGIEASLRFCAGGALSGSCTCNTSPLDTCVPPSYFQSLGVPVPSACTAEHGSCTPDGRTIDRPCCPGLSCAVGSQCGGAGGGECLKL